MEGSAVAEGQEQAKAERPETEYLVLQRIDDGTWQEVGTAPGGPAPAMKAKVEESGTYVAVPMRSWKPREVKVETKPTVTFG